MSKKPFSIRVEPHVVNKYKALSTVLNIDGATLLSELINNAESNLNKEQLSTYESLLKLWKS
ncbi:hypothetical protein CU633_01785 [Bacillus sp. V3-13]|uniref:hypothetical protein n=1 Tax=Bacillus sp. V3-13 TaxID=2053728 RepID=UPI000C7690BC|nr:hypothetical protein [Bacillus sp. V3-13]PLR79125.1 hypothetical protein CU633_01785 [Bacillus sp. V3-13]